MLKPHLGATVISTGAVARIQHPFFPPFFVQEQGPGLMVLHASEHIVVLGPGKPCSYFTFQFVSICYPFPVFSFPFHLTAHIF